MYNEYINIYKKLKNSQLKLDMALILFIICCVPMLSLISFDNSFHFFAAKYLQDLRPCLVVFTLGKFKMLSPLKIYFDERILIRLLIAKGAILDKLLY